MNPTGPTEPVARPTLREIRNAAICDALARHNGKKMAVSQELDISLKTLYNIIKREGLCPKPY